MRYDPANYDRSDSVADRDFLWVAYDLAVDRVLGDPTDREIVLAVEEMLDRRIPKGYEQRFFDAIVAVYDGTSKLVEHGELLKADIDHVVLSAVNRYGLC